MSRPFANPKVELMRYGIREIVDVAQKIKELDPNATFTFENIGDPIAKSWPVPKFLKEILTAEINKESDEVFGYTHSRGNPETRKWVVEYAKRYSPNNTLDYEYVLFTSGLGAAIASIYHMLKKGSRIIQPTPSYPTHASMESFAAEAEPITYTLDPLNHWEPDLNDLEAKIQAHPEIAGILVINPNNPTGAVYSLETLEKIVNIAEKYKLFIISDEVYFRMVFNGHTQYQITELCQNRVPLIVMRGLSKDIPWPGSRCGWLEFHNVDLDPEFKLYAESVKKRVLMEVCSVTLPQKVLAQIYDHPGFTAWNQQYNQELEQTGNMIADILSEIPELIVNKTNGAFYMMPLFRPGVLSKTQSLPIANPEVKAYIEAEVNKENFPLDKRFTYYLLAATGIVVVPASGFFSPYYGFRITTLDRDPVRRQETYKKVVAAIKEYIKS